MRTATVTTVLSAPQPAVFDYLADIENLPLWATEFARELRREGDDYKVVNGLGEFFFAINLTSIRAATMPVFLVGFITSEGLYWAKLCAAATLASVPVLVAGWLVQRQLVRGLSMGAIK